jgi:hypothetical protein
MNSSAGTGDGSADLQILGAAYGLARVTSQVIGIVNRGTTPQSLSVTASDQDFDGQWPDHQKSLTVVYRTGSAGVAQVATATEGNPLAIHAQAQPRAGSTARADTWTDGLRAFSAATTAAPQLTVFGASYGPQDVTGAVKRLIDPSAQSLSVTPSDQVFSTDPWPNTVKTFVIVAAYPGQVPFLDIVTEGTPYLLKYRPSLRILVATWGMSEATAAVRAAVSRRTLTISASSDQLGDGSWPAAVFKSLDVVYQYGDEQPQLAIATEGQTLSVDYQPQGPYVPNPDPRALNVIRAAYGRAEVTDKVKGLVSNNRLQFGVSSGLFGDNWPDTQKAFMCAYSWGPDYTRPVAPGAQGGLILGPDGSQWDLSQPPPADDLGVFVSLAGLLADGDGAVIEASNGLYWGIDGATGHIIANADSVSAATKFTVHVADPQSGQVTLSDPAGSRVVAGADGLLQAQSGAAPAVLIPSLSAAGSILLSVIGQARSFAALTPDGTIMAAGGDLPTFDASFSLRLNANQGATKNHLRAHGIALEAELDVSLPLMKLAWDLTGGFLLAIGLGPLLNEGRLRTGALALIRQNPRVEQAFQSVISAVKADPGTTVALGGTGGLLVFIGVLWDEGLMWPLLRAGLRWGVWSVAAWAAFQVMKWVLAGEVEAADLAVSFAFWAYTVTTDALAYINSRPG